ncbi:hypothetical protein M9H77_12337 [Catharanthus roseus]|uniref:Uncharacterized protein n=1 Tax=Catharanthus roseus TaxID=4058 RepID=A0ACC0BH95_CATRO|nr:hypothetical protein M9H77_12337 [Catharanthus roseus]
MWTSHHALRWDGRLVESQEGLETEVGPRADLSSLERSGAQQATGVLGQEFLDQISPEGHIVVHYCEDYNLVPRGTQMPYSAAVDLVAGLGASQMTHSSHRWTYKEGTLVDEHSRTTSSSSSYSLREIVLEREPIPMIDLSDDESVEGPEMAPRGDLPNGRLILRGTLGTATEDDEGRHVREGLSPDAGGSCSPREIEILEQINERNWLRQFIAQFLGTIRDSVDRARDELESRPGYFGSQCPQAEVSITVDVY